MINIVSIAGRAAFHALGHVSAPEFRSFAALPRAAPGERPACFREALSAELDVCSRELAPGFAFVIGDAPAMAEVVREVGGECGWVVVDVSYATISRFVTGQPNAPRSRLMLEAYRRHRFIASTDAEALAYWSARYGIDALSRAQHHRARENITQELIG